MEQALLASNILQMDEHQQFKENLLSRYTLNIGKKQVVFELAVLTKVNQPPSKREAVPIYNGLLNGLSSITLQLPKRTKEKGNLFASVCLSSMCILLVRTDNIWQKE